MNNQKRQSAKRIRGTAIFADDDSMEFIPQSQGSPKQRKIKRYRKSKFYETEGEKESSIVCHLVADRNDPEAYNTICEDFEHIFSDTQVPVRTLIRGRRLMDDNNIIVICNRNGLMQININLDLQWIDNIQNEMVKTLYKITQCLASNKTYLAKLKSALEKSSTK